MNGQLIDASVWISTTDPEDPRHTESVELIRSLRDRSSDLAILDLTVIEVANVSMRIHGREFAKSLVRELFATAGQSILRVDAETMDRAIDVAASKSISAYDALYVAAAEMFDLQLVSCDERDLVGNGLAVLPADAVN